MTKAKDVGVYQLENGMWGFRFVMMVDGKQITSRRSTDENGNRLSSSRKSYTARCKGPLHKCCASSFSFLEGLFPSFFLSIL